MRREVIVGLSLLSFAAIGPTASALAAPILVIKNFGAVGDNQNDCSGTFGKANNGADKCDVGRPLGEDISPWIAKYDTDGDDWEVNADFSAIDGGEFTITGGGSGTWTYTPDDASDPVVRYWVAKGGNQGFRLHWMIDDSAANLATCAGDPYTAACLNLALAVNGGNWATPTTQGLSHMTFYDSGRQVPEPATLTLFGALALAAGIRRRRLHQ